MHPLRYLLLILSISVYNGLCKRSPCSYKDSKCLLNLIKENHLIIKNGIPGKIESSDPLYVNEVSGDLPEMKFKLKNIIFKGLKDCQPALIHVKIESNKYLFDYNLDCDVLDISKEYEVHGHKAGLPANAVGENTVTMHNFKLITNGEFKYSKGENGDIHVEVIDFQVKTVVNGEVEIEDKTIVEAPGTSKETREQWKYIEELFRPFLMKSFIGKYFKNVNDYLKLKPLEVTFE